MGLGKWVVEGGNTIRFCPKYPKDIIQFNSIKETLNTSQKESFSLILDAHSYFGDATSDMRIQKNNLDVAENNGVLSYVGSTYDSQNNAIYSGLSREGIRVVTFAPLLQDNMMPMAEVIEQMLDMGMWGMGTHVEIEFAINLNMSAEKKMDFALLQIKPFVTYRERDELQISDVDPSKLLCQSDQVLGHGLIDNVYDIVAVDYKRFERSSSREVASEIASFNAMLVKENRPYLLIGIGRWGSLDPWLGIPVVWEQISGAKVIIETGFKDINVTPSQGTHFFQNLTSFMVGYFTINNSQNNNFLDWDWLLNCDIIEKKKFTALYRFKKPLITKINAHMKKGIILKPED